MNMKIAQGILFIQLLGQITKCSRIIDKHSQKGIPMDDYCHKIGVCEEGTHVMCLYYNPNRLMGPACQNYVNITITPDYAQIILNIMNKIRSKAAKGTLKGKDDILLPRGYGIYRLEWDEELATFAQLWANQCILKNDMCHATKKFPEPGQTLGLIRYTIKDWKPINFPDFSNSTSLTPDKVKYAILSVLEAWYDLKSFMTPDDIRQLDTRTYWTLWILLDYYMGSAWALKTRWTSVEWRTSQFVCLPSSFPHDLFHYRKKASQFPYLIHGRSTHIGCGLSAYSEFAYHNNRADLIYNSIQMVCNYSTRVRRGTSVYTTDPPTKPGYTVRCGCPLGYDEDNDCLCYRSGRSLANNYSCKDNERCKPAVVVLPIFKVEEAPAPKIGNNVTRLLDTTHEIFDRYDMAHKRTVNDYLNLFDNLQHMDHTGDDINRRFPLDVQSRRFGLKSTSQNFDHSSIHHHVKSLQNQKYSTKRSIFAKPIFELPIRRTKTIFNYTKNRQTHIPYKKDVPPRKDFTDAQQLAAKYLKGKRVFNISNMAKGTTKYTNNAYNYLNSTNRIIININSHTDANLMKILDKLELEVRNAKLNKNNKELYDSKFRKIYGSLIGRTDAFEHNDSFGNGFNDSDIVKKYDTILKSKPKYRNRKEFELNDGKNYLNTGLRYKYLKDNYGITDYINDTEDDKKSDGRRKLKEKSTKIVRKDFLDSNYEYGNDDLFALDSNRRSFYENKLKSLQRKLEYIKRNGNKHRVSKDRRLRPVRPTKATKEFPYEKPKEPINSFYMPDRARFLHGF